MRSLATKFKINSTLKNKSGFDRYVLDNFDPKEKEMKEKPVDHGMFYLFFIAVF